jgi:hypothetical protein
MVLTDDITDDPRRLLVRLVPVVRQLVHGEENTTMHRLQAVASVGQGTADNHAHGVIEIRSTHLVFETDGQGFFGEGFHFFPLSTRHSGGMSSS